MQPSILFLVRSLNTGGAERQLVTLASGLHARGVKVTVVTFYRGGTMALALLRTGVRVCDLGKGGRWDVIGFVWRLVRQVRSERPAVLYCFLPTANVLGAVLRPFLGVPRVVLGIRASSFDLSHYDWIARFEVRLAAVASRFADVIVANSEAGRQHCVRQGYPAQRCFVVPNGIDTDRFVFDSVGRRRLRSEWKINNGEILVGIVARLDPLKDHCSFLRAAKELIDSGMRMRFVCVGGGSGSYAEGVRTMASEFGLDPHLLWVEETVDTTAVYSSLDVLCSSSVSEGFSNAVAEGMACERVCVATDVGDTRRIIGDKGKVVEPRNPSALAAACREVASMPAEQRILLGTAARARVKELFSVDRLLSGTQALLGLA